MRIPASSGFTYALFLSPFLIVMFIWLWRLIEHYYATQESRQITRWHTVPGRVIRSDVKLWKQSSYQGGLWRTYTFYQPDIVYEYQIEGRIYHASRIKFGLEERYKSEELARQEAAAYPVEASVIVSYEPLNPTQAVLEPVISDTSQRIMGYAITILVFLGFIVFSIISFLRSRGI
jgi:hypothetical protein